MTSYVYSWVRLVKQIYDSGLGLLDVRYCPVSLHTCRIEPFATHINGLSQKLRLLSRIMEGEKKCVFMF